MALQHHTIAGAPDPVAPFSHAVEADGWVYLIGQMPFSGTSIHKAYPQGIAAQTHQVIHNLQTVLTEKHGAAPCVAFARAVRRGANARRKAAS